MTPLNVVLLTGPSSAGKTYLQKQLIAAKLPCLDNDHEVMARFFDLLPKVEGDNYRGHIGNVEFWRPARQLVDYDRTVRLLHRDWYLRNDRPANFVAVGWMYSQKDHRDQLTAAFRQVPEIAIRTTIVRLITDENVFVERYIKRQNEALAEEWTPIVEIGEAACVAHARSMRENYLNNDWQSPTDGTPVDDVKDLSEALNVIERFFDSGTRGKVAQPSL